MTLVDGPEVITWTAGKQDGGTRLDLAVASIVPGCTRNTAARLIKKGLALVNDSAKKPGYRLVPGDTVKAAVSIKEKSHRLAAEPLDVDIVFQDLSVIVINKPAGLVVHPAAGNFSGTLAHGLIYHFPELRNVCAEPERPGIIHRLDKDTSGIMVIARNSDSLKNLSLQFKTRSVYKTYIAFVHGNPDSDEGTIASPISRHPVHRKKMTADAGDPEKARHAQTSWRVAERYGTFAMLECSIKTGRTHQIRVHLSSIGYPVIGDQVYGYKNPRRLYKTDPEAADLASGARRQMLHAAEIAFTHPETGKYVRFTASMPDDMTGLRKALLKHSGRQTGFPQNPPTVQGHDPVF